MTDRFQQLKGLLGQELAKLFLTEIRQWKIVCEEAAVEGCNGRSRLDIVAKDDSERFIPVEVKFQEYGFQAYGNAFEHVLRELARPEKVFALSEDARRIELSRPQLFLWYPPAKSITRIPNYSDIDITRFDQVIADLEQRFGEGYGEVVGEIIKKKTENFFNFYRGGWVLNGMQTRRLYELYPP